jgi:hypothetical protein
MIVVQYSTRHLVRPSAGIDTEEACHEILIRQIRSSKRTLGTTNYTRVSSYFLCLMTPENTRVWGRTHCPADIPWLCCEDQCRILQSCLPKSNDGLVSHIEWQKIAELHSSKSSSLVTPFSLTPHLHHVLTNWLHTQRFLLFVDIQNSVKISESTIFYKRLVSSLLKS